MDGHHSAMNSTRAERAGFKVPLLVTLKIATHYNLNKGSLTMHVDNMGSYPNGRSPAAGKSTFKYLTSDYDLKLHKTYLDIEYFINRT